ncbi:MAG TPA: DNA mismatch repair protein MutS [Thermodesulfobacteriota bacterium]|nr:DNA mismatch repair protein MutS [Thermodesulfobacteriota bacterium]
MTTKPLTPVIKQYLQIKSQYPDSILFFRMGDFYEMFFEDAHVGSRELDIALTSRDKGQKDSVPLCGVPYFAAEAYISKLLQKGYKVALCDQVEDPKLAKGIVKREVVRVFTPGLVTDSIQLGTGENNYLMGFYAEGEVFGVAFLDISTGELKACQISGLEAFLSEALRNEPKEILSLKKFQEHPCFEGFEESFESGLITYLDDPKFDTFSSFSEKEWNSVMQKAPLAAQAAGMVLRYAEENQKKPLSHVRPLSFYRVQDFMVIDEVTKRNLELTQSLFEQGKRGSLFWLLDETITLMGSRTLKQWLNYPLMDVKEIESRLEGVSELKEKMIERKRLRESLKGIQDIERLTSRIFLGHANARDLIGLKNSLQSLPLLKANLDPLDAPILKEFISQIEDFEDLCQLLESSIVDHPPLTIREGGIIKPKYDKELDGLREVGREGKGWILELEAEERKRTGISSLKVRYNQVFGYYIEVTKSNLHLVPDHFIRKQTLVNAERFITPELKEFETKVLGAEEAICQLEYRLFEEVRKRVSDETPRLQRTASAIAIIDILGSMAEIADRYNYVRPNVDEEDEIIIRDGRHPVLERMGLSERFVPNDTQMDSQGHQLLIITGPNMAGKSTYLRQVALIILMAQMGCFVPASEAKIAVVDRVFTRIGALDNLMRGQSTFMVEMMETARILNQATSRSLVVLDEIGRGTSTFDGLSIAWAVAEFLHDHPSLRPKTLFATHYHELTELALTKERVKNYNVAVKEWGGEIIFLRKIVEGGTNRSYGIQVARLAGLPQKVIDRAKEILSNLEKGELDAAGMPKIATTKMRTLRPKPPLQPSLFVQADPVRAELKKIKTDHLTPVEALNILDELKKKVEKEE